MPRYFTVHSTIVTMVTWVWFMRMLFLSFTSIALSVNCLILFINLIKKVEIPEGRLLAFYNGVRLHHTRWKIQKKNLQPRYMWQIFVRHFFALDKARKTTNNCIQPHKVLRKTNNCIQPRNICMPIVIRIHTLTTENNINLLVESDKGTPQTIVVNSDQVII